MSAAGERDPVEQLAEEFLERYRHGEHPPLSEYTTRHPELADRIHELFPALIVLEELGSVGGPSGAPGPSVAAGAIPEQLGDYRILREIGRGGMGVVYEAVQESLGRHVALKVLPYPGLSSPMHQERFQREARAAARLHHSNIVPVFGVGEWRAEGVSPPIHYYAMQFIHGQGLDVILKDVERLRGGTPASAADAPVSGAARGLCNGHFLDAQQPGSSSTVLHAQTAVLGRRAELAAQTEVQYFRSVARLGLQVAEALAYAHQHGVLHRDIKPSNLLLDTAGTVWITDFGLAKLEGSAELTHTGDLVGTLRYMAPERLQGLSDPRSDVYSLGATLYELLTLRPAFAEDNRARLLEQIARQEPPRPRQRDRRLPRDLETMVLKAMAKDPADRYASAEALAGDLQRFLTDQPILARRTWLHERGWRWCRRNPWLAGLSALVVLLLVTIAVGSLVSALLLQKQVDTAHANLAEARLAQAQALQRTDLAGRRFEGLKALDEARSLFLKRGTDETRTLRLRNETIASLVLADLAPIRRWEGPSRPATSVAYSARAGRFAQSDPQGTISIREVETGREVVQLPGAGHRACTLILSPDGRHLSAEYDCSSARSPNQLKLWDCAQAKIILEAPFEVNGQPDFSADGRWAALPQKAGPVAVYDLHATPPSRTDLAPANRPEYGYVAFHPRERKLAVSRAKGTVEVWELAGAGDRPSAVLRPPQEVQIYGLAWSPDGNLLAVASGSVIRLWQGKESRLLQGHGGQVRELAFSSDGALLASKGYDNTLRLWDVLTGRPLVRCTCVYTDIAQMQFSHDNQRLGLGWDGDHLCLWEVAQGQECRVLPVRFALNPAAARSFSVDGRVLVVAVAEEAYLWDVASPGPAVVLPAKACRSACFTPDGKQLLTSGQEGVQCWPIESVAPHEMRFGPKQVLWQENALEHSCFNPKGQVLAAHQTKGVAVILDLARRNAPIRIQDHPQLYYVALSTDAKWLATGTLLGKQVRIWNATTGELVRDLPIDSRAAMRFSPDDRWLVVSTPDGYQFWDTAEWTCRYRVSKQWEYTPAEVSFLQDGSLAALRHSPTQLHLIDSSTGRQFAEFQPPGQRLILWHCLSPDGTHLAAACNDRVILLWDLRLIRRQLAEKGLDWNPPLPPLPAAEPTLLRFTIHAEAPP